MTTQKKTQNEEESNRNDELEVKMKEDEQI